MSMTSEQVKANSDLQEYQININCAISKSTGNRYMQCPFCKKYYDHYLLFMDGMVFCKHCMGLILPLALPDILSKIANESLSVLINGQLIKLNNSIIDFIRKNIK